MHISFLVLGFFYSISQVILIREFLVIFYGNEIFIGFVFASWFFWIGVGSLVFSRMADTTKRSVHLFIILQLLLPLLLVFQVAGIRMVRLLFDASAAEILPLFSSMVATGILSMPCSIIIGMLFPLGCRIAADKDASGTLSINRIYIAETFGTAAGGLLFSLILARTISHPTLVILCAGIIGINILVLCRKQLKGDLQGRARRRYATIAIIMVVVSFLCVVLPVRKIISERAHLMRWKTFQPDLEYVASANSPYQNIAVGKHGSQYSVLGDGKFITSFPEKHEHIEYAAILFAQKPAAKRILIIGRGAEGLLQRVLAYPVESVDLVEQDPLLFNMMEQYLPDGDRKALKDSRVSHHFTDGRRFVQEYPQEEYYDIIALRLPEPSSAFLNRYYTEEFFRAVKRILKKDGLVVTAALSTENYIAPDVASYTGSLYHTLKRIFPHIAIAPGDQVLYCASPSRGVVTDDHELLQKRYDTVPLVDKNNRFPSDGFRTVFPPERVQFVTQKFEQLEAEINTDFKPITYYFNILLWSSFSGSEWVKVIDTIRTGGRWVFILPFVFLVALRMAYTGRFHKKDAENRFNAYLAVCVAGMVTMGLQIILIFLFQSLFGYIYEQIGMVTALFMIGLGVGAYTMRRVINKYNKPDVMVMGCLIAMGMFLIFIPFLASRFISEPAFYTLFCVSGLLAGSIFPAGVQLFSLSRAGIGETAGILDAADHTGAMVGSLIGGALMVPLFGVHSSCWILGIFAFLTVLPIILTRVSKNRQDTLISYRSFPFWKISWVIIAITGCLYAATSVIRMHQEETISSFTDSRLGDVSGSVRFAHNKDPFVHYAGFDEKNKNDTITLNTRHTAYDIRGYAGPIDLLVSVSTKGRLKHVEIIDSQETPAYIKGIDTWLQKLTAINTEDTFPITKNHINAMTAATVTCDAIVGIVNRSLSRIDQEIFNRSDVTIETTYASPWPSFFMDLRLYGMAGLVLLSVWFYLTKGKKYRLALMTVNLLFFGLYTNMLITLTNIGQISAGILPGLENIRWIVFTVLILVISVLFGQVFCGYICPFGILQELLSLFGLTRPPHPFIEQRARYVKYLILAGVLWLFWISGAHEWLMLNPMNYIFGRKLNNTMIILTGIIMVSSVFFVRFWCRYFCPAGAFFSLFNKIELLKRFAPAKNYDRCDLGVRGYQDIDCIKCNRCRQ